MTPRVTKTVKVTVGVTKPVTRAAVRSGTAVASPPADLFAYDDLCRHCGNKFRTFVGNVLEVCPQCIGNPGDRSLGEVLMIEAFNLTELSEERKEELDRLADVERDYDKLLAKLRKHRKAHKDGKATLEEFYKRVCADIYDVTEDEDDDPEKS